MYAGEVGVPRLLKLFDKYNIKATWFIPGQWHLGYSSHPTGIRLMRDEYSTQCRDVPRAVSSHPRRGRSRNVSASRYLSAVAVVGLPLSSGLHGYTHERQTRLTVEQQKDVLDRSYEVLTKFNNGVPPKGSCAPCWDTSRENTRLLLEKGIEYGERQRPIMVRRYETWPDLSSRSLEHGSRVRRADIPVYYSTLADHRDIIAHKPTICALMIPGRRSITKPARRPG